MKRLHQVSSTVYDDSFFEKVYGKDNNTINLEGHYSKEYYNEIVNLIKVPSMRKVVDYGCGNGTLSFMLSSKYNCRVIGFDYSDSAIKICKRRLKTAEEPLKSRVEFFTANNDNLPALRDVFAVYFCDVIEHMYNHEITLAINTIKTWSKKKTRIVIHTDNDVYLNLVRPWINLSYWITGKKTLNQLKVDKKEEDRVHINLTNPVKLTKLMTKLGVRHIKTSYPSITNSKISKQLGPLGRSKTLVSFVKVTLNLFTFLSPSFFAIYEV